MINKLVPLLQLSDSNFPSGAFSHSFGLETYIQDEVITDKNSFSEALSIYVKKQLVFVDGLACRLAYEALEEGDLSAFLELDQLLYTSSLARETRLGNKRIGERMAKLCIDLYPSSFLNDYLDQIKKKEAYGHSALAFAAVAHHLQVPKDTAIETYLFTTVSSLVQNAVRGIPLGQTDGQKLLVEIQPLLEEAVRDIFQLTTDDFGAISPGLEVAQMCHERLHVRLFMS
ncbi:urease accessory protein UreF [Desertibacillus haloalkaliphilus]|uniref:urease accessory protein UreF n=1 Tax=Desertibacillus haloalkaliphilus TaxID=1328930 RepID=UPI001C265C97|nr:urease accessory protein UreF [Desertibacillus haloalkaliphilus]MBU8906642.1 urease accessory protein UreF [Desertibacillus haloalkaliphilus]